MIFRARQHEFRFPRPAVVMGILNVTPDSFYDGGRHAEPAAAIDHAHALIAQGAEIIDVGGESTRPRAKPVSVKDELTRVIPIISELARYSTGPHPNPLPEGEGTKASDDSQSIIASAQSPILPLPLGEGRGEGSPSKSNAFLISIDTQKPEVAREAIAAGAHIINNIAAAACSLPMWEVAISSGAGYIAMHMQGTPQTMHKHPRYEDVVREIRDFFANQFEQLTAAGVLREQIAFDVGIGFGKTLEHNLQLLARLDQTRVAGRPMVLGVSRKSFMGRLLKLEPDQRLAPALACSVWAASRGGAEIFRTHDVAETVAALRMIEAIRDERGQTDSH